MLRRNLAKRLRALALMSFAGAACAQSPPRLLIFGEQHDQPDQQRQMAQAVAERAADGRLAAVVIEMAQAPYGTAGLPADASEARVQQALHWHGWPWPAYAAVIMNAVRAGVPVWGGNLPGSRNHAAMNDAQLDARVPDAARAVIADAVREGHCNLLPQDQLGGMVRIQIARDQSLAQVVDDAMRRAEPPQQVLLLTGAQHASRDRGVPLQLLAQGRWQPDQIRVVMFNDDAGLAADERRAATVTPQPDRCAALRRRLHGASAPATAAATP